MLITFTGPDNIMFGAGFFGGNGLHVEVINGSSTRLVLEQPDTGVITTVTGSGFALDGQDSPVSGTITGFSFALDGSVRSTVSGVNWNLVTFVNALDEIDMNDNHAPMGALMSTSPIVIDGSGAVGGMDLSDFEDIAPFITSTVTGTGFDDRLGGASWFTLPTNSNPCWNSGGIKSFISSRL